MSFIVVLICLSVQWFLKFSGADYQLHWADPYCRWMQQRITSLTNGQGWIAVILLVIPIVLVSSLVFTLVYHGLGRLGYLILSLALLWYCLDVRCLQRAADVPQLFLTSYQRIFALLFWYFIFGPVGLILYVVVNTVRLHVEAQSVEESMRQTVLPDLIKTQGILDWVPIRLLGLTFALAGHFSAVFSRWIAELFQPISINQHQVVAWGEAALQSDSTNLSEAISFVQRVLVIWLVMMALVSLGFWLG